MRVIQEPQEYGCPGTRWAVASEKQTTYVDFINKFGYSVGNFRKGVL
jgi:hypothetical protein